MNSPPNQRFRAHDSRRDPDDPKANAHSRAELEGQLADALEALARQQREAEENATSFSQVMARLSHSERTLGQTKAKLMAAEERFETGEAQAAAELKVQAVELTRHRHALDAAQARELEQSQSMEALRAQNAARALELEEAHECSARALAQEKALRDLAESLSRDSADGAAECARLNERCKEAEELEQRALGRAMSAEAEHTSLLTQLNESKQREAELSEQQAALKQALDAALIRIAGLQATLAESEVARAHDQQTLASAEHERARFIGMFGALEALGREVTEIGFQARKAAETRTKVDSDEPESDRVTLRPAAAPKLANVRTRSSAAPEITVDGILLEPKQQ